VRGSPTAVALLLFWVLLCVAPPLADAVAQDVPDPGVAPDSALLSPQDPGKKDDGNKKKKPKPKPKKTAEQKMVEAIAADFKGAKVSALLSRWPGKKKKVHLTLGKKSDSYSKDQGKGVLEAWFKERTVQTLKFARMRNTSTGEFDLTVRRPKKDKTEKRRLRVTIGKQGEKLVLLSLKVEKV